MNPRTTLPLAAIVLLCAVPSLADPAAPAAAGFTEAIPGTDITFDMVPIPAGSFMMGSPDGEEGRQDDEGPQFEVRVDAFHMGKHEVTCAEYQEFLKNYHRIAGIVPRPPGPPEDRMADAVTYPTPMHEGDAGPILDRMGRGPRAPAVIMSHFGARQYTKWLSKKTGRFYRLPTEAEWEYACRAGSTTAYHFGDDPEQLAEHGWCLDNSALADKDPAYRHVGRKKPNAWGLYDMHGNVAELVLDQYSPDWYRQFAGKSVTWEQAVHWPTQQYPRVVRGGGYESEGEDCRSAWRYGTKNVTDNKNDPQGPRSPHWLSAGFWIGFRIVSPAKEPAEPEKLKYWNADDPNTKFIVYGRDREIHELVEPAPRAAAAGK